MKMVIIMIVFIFTHKEQQTRFSDSPCLHASRPYMEWFTDAKVQLLLADILDFKYFERDQ